MISILDIKDAFDRISGHIHKTPILSSKTIDRLVGAEVLFKCENLQKTGSFKIRGATNAVKQLSTSQLSNGIATVSSGNHGAALSVAGTRINTPVTVIMPSNTSKIKIENVKRSGGNIVWCEPNQRSREKTLEKVVSDTGAAVVHPYNDARVIAGQGTAGLEIVSDYPDIDAIITPVSGGGLLSGTLLSAKYTNPKIKVYGAEPLEADDTFRSLQEGKIVPNKTTNTICDGLRAQVGSITFPIIQKYVDDIFIVNENDIVSSMQLIWSIMKIVVEPSSAIALSALVSNKKQLKGKTVAIILSGGNVDLSNLPWAC